jgi:hypothetical protein
LRRESLAHLRDEGIDRAAWPEEQRHNDEVTLTYAQLTPQKRLEGLRWASVKRLGRDVGRMLQRDGMHRLR